MNYSIHTLKQKSTKSFIGEWVYKEGVFITKAGKWIARIKDEKSRYRTLSQHDEKEDAEKVYNDYNLKK